MRTNEDTLHASTTDAIAKMQNLLNENHNEHISAYKAKIEEKLDKELLLVGEDKSLSNEKRSEKIQSLLGQKDMASAKARSAYYKDLFNEMTSLFQIVSEYSQLEPKTIPPEHQATFKKARDLYTISAIVNYSDDKIMIDILTSAEQYTGAYNKAISQPNRPAEIDRFHKQYSSINKDILEGNLDKLLAIDILQAQRDLTYCENFMKMDERKKTFTTEQNNFNPAFNEISKQLIMVIRIATQLQMEKAAEAAYKNNNSKDNEDTLNYARNFKNECDNIRDKIVLPSQNLNSLIQTYITRRTAKLMKESEADIERYTTKQYLSFDIFSSENNISLEDYRKYHTDLDTIYRQLPNADETNKHKRYLANLLTTLNQSASDKSSSAFKAATIEIENQLKRIEEANKLAEEARENIIKLRIHAIKSIHKADKYQVAFEYLSEYALNNEKTGIKSILEASKIHPEKIFTPYLFDRINRIKSELSILQLDNQGTSEKSMILKSELSKIQSSLIALSKNPATRHLVIDALTKHQSKLNVDAVIDIIKNGSGNEEDIEKGKSFINTLNTDTKHNIKLLTVLNAEVNIRNNQSVKLDESRTRTGSTGEKTTGLSMLDSLTSSFRRDRNATVTDTSSRKTKNRDRAPTLLSIPSKNQAQDNLLTATSTAREVGEAKKIKPNPAINLFRQSNDYEELRTIYKELNSLKESRKKLYQKDKHTESIDRIKKINKILKAATARIEALEKSAVEWEKIDSAATTLLNKNNIRQLREELQKATELFKPYQEYLEPRFDLYRGSAAIPPPRVTSTYITHLPPALEASSTAPTPAHSDSTASQVSTKQEKLSAPTSTLTADEISINKDELELKLIEAEFNVVDNDPHKIILAKAEVILDWINKSKSESDPEVAMALLNHIQTIYGDNPEIKSAVGQLMEQRVSREKESFESILNLSRSEYDGLIHSIPFDLNDSEELASQKLNDYKLLIQLNGRINEIDKLSLSDSVQEKSSEEKIQFYQDLEAELTNIQEQFLAIRAKSYSIETENLPSEETAATAIKPAHFSEENEIAEIEKLVAAQEAAREETSVANDIKYELEFTALEHTDSTPEEKSNAIADLILKWSDEAEAKTSSDPTYAANINKFIQQYYLDNPQIEPLVSQKRETRRDAIMSELDDLAASIQSSPPTAGNTTTPTNLQPDTPNNIGTRRELSQPMQPLTPSSPAQLTPSKKAMGGRVKSLTELYERKIQESQQPKRRWSANIETPKAVQHETNSRQLQLTAAQESLHASQINSAKQMVREAVEQCYAAMQAWQNHADFSADIAEQSQAKHRVTVATTTVTDIVSKFNSGDITEANAKEAVKAIKEQTDIIKVETLMWPITKEKYQFDAAIKELQQTINTFQDEDTKQSLFREISERTRKIDVDTEQAREEIGRTVKWNLQIDSGDTLSNTQTWIREGLEDISRKVRETVGSTPGYQPQPIPGRLSGNLDDIFEATQQSAPPVMRDQEVSTGRNSERLSAIITARTSASPAPAPESLPRTSNLQQNQLPASGQAAEQSTSTSSIAGGSSEASHVTPPIQFQAAVPPVASHDNVIVTSSAATPIVAKSSAAQAHRTSGTQLAQPQPANNLPDNASELIRESNEFMNSINAKFKPRFFIFPRSDKWKVEQIHTLAKTAVSDYKDNPQKIDLVYWELDSYLKDHPSVARKYEAYLQHSDTVLGEVKGFENYRTEQKDKPASEQNRPSRKEWNKLRKATLEKISGSSQDDNNKIKQIDLYLIRAIQQDDKGGFALHPWERRAIYQTINEYFEANPSIRSQYYEAKNVDSFARAEFLLYKPEEWSPALDYFKQPSSNHPDYHVYIREEADTVVSQLSDISDKDAEDLAAQLSDISDKDLAKLEADVKKKMQSARTHGAAEGSSSISPPAGKGILSRIFNWLKSLPTPETPSSLPSPSTDARVSSRLSTPPAHSSQPMPISSTPSSAIVPTSSTSTSSSPANLPASTATSDQQHRATRAKSLPASTLTSTHGTFAVKAHSSHSTKSTPSAKEGTTPTEEINNDSSKTRGPRSSI